MGCNFRPIIIERSNNSGTGLALFVLERERIAKKDTDDGHQAPHKCHLIRVPSPQEPVFKKRSVFLFLGPY